MLGQILRFLLDTVLGFFIFVLLARFYLQLLRAPFRNPLGQLPVGRRGLVQLNLRRQNVARSASLRIGPSKPNSRDIDQMS